MPELRTISAEEARAIPPHWCEDCQEDHGMDLLFAERDRRNVAVLAEQQDAALALHTGNHVCVSTGGEVLPFGPRSIRGDCPTARALAVKLDA
jgi:hypothetical protein